MNKKLFTLLSLICISPACMAQIPTLTGANMNPVINDSFLNVVCDEAHPSASSPGSSGASVTWNFSGLVTTPMPDSINLGRVINPLIAPGYSTAISGATHAIVTPSSTITNYYIASASKLSLNAVYSSPTDFAIYTNPMDVLTFPFTYLSNVTDPYAGGLSFMGASVTQAGTVNVIGDGWGTLILPPVPPSTANRTFDSVLRVHSTQSFTDSVNLVGSTPVTYTIETYTWYRPGYHSALMSYATIIAPGFSKKTVSYARKQLANHVSVPSVAGIEATLSVYPNPATNQVNISFNTNANDGIRINLTDILGREVAVLQDSPLSGAQNITCNTSALSKGLYFVNIHTTNGSVSRKVEIQ